MRKMKKSVTRALHCICMFSMLACLRASATQSQLDEVRNDIQHLQEEQQEHQANLQELKENKAYLDGELLELNTQLTAVSEKLSGIQIQLTEKEEEIAHNRQKLKEARKTEAIQYENMKKRIQFMYERGNSNMLEMIFDTGSFAEFLNISEYVESVHLYDRQKLSEYQKIKEEIAAREVRLEEEQQELKVLAQKQEEAKGEVEQLLAEVEDNINHASAQIADAEHVIAENEQQLAQQRAYEEELEAKKAAEDAKRLEEIKKQEAENQAPPVVSDSASDLAMLSALIECEAGGESYEGKLAVGSVVMNRVRSAYFPNSVVEVIYQSGQFTPVASGRFAVVLSRGASKECISAAKETLSGKLTLDCLYFRRNTGTIAGTVIGGHVFY